MRGGGRATPQSYQELFTQQLRGGTGNDTVACDTQAIANHVPNPMTQFVPPTSMPQGNSARVDVTLPDVAVQAYNRYYYPR